MAEYIEREAVNALIEAEGFLDTRYKTSLWIEWLKMECKEAKDFESWRLTKE